MNSINFWFTVEIVTAVVCRNLVIYLYYLLGKNVDIIVRIYPSATRTSSQVTFPVDFFEHNQQLTEIEFGGNDLLQVYNGQQIKHRLNSTGMYVANTKVGKFLPK